MEQLSTPVLRVVGKTPRVTRVENQSPKTLRVEPIIPRIQVPAETQYYTKKNHDNFNLTRRSTDVSPPLYQYPNESKYIEAANHMDTVTSDTSFYSGKLQMNAVIHTNTGFAQEYRHLVKRD